MKKLRIKSFTRDAWYTINADARTCDCPRFQRAGKCKHLESLGLYHKTPFTPKTHPTFSQALSVFIKSIRIRDVNEAVYWLTYLDTFPDEAQRFRTARRILVGSAEDGLSVAVMEKAAENFNKYRKKGSELLYRVAEVLRICKLPNWWHTDSGGVEYIYAAMVGQRRLGYEKWDKKSATALGRLKEAIQAGDKIGAMEWLDALGQVKDVVSQTKIVEEILKWAEERDHEDAARVARVHLSQKSALAEDNNFMGQAVWMLAGGVLPLMSTIFPVTAGECYGLMEKAKEAWKTPHLIPTWGCDGIHCAGNDTRFAGVLPEMVAVCRAFAHYGRVDPSDEWLPEFHVMDGLVVE